jgi:hypothetical protein
LIHRAALVALLLFAGRSVADAQRVVLRDAGPGGGPQPLRAAISGQYVVIPPSNDAANLPRDTTFNTTVIVLGRDATVASRVHGDVIVIDGDLFIHPGASIDGRAIAYGGGVYNSLLAMSRGRFGFRDFTYEITPIPEGFALDYRTRRADPSPPVSWPGVFGIGVPLYDRSNGLSLGGGPLISLDTGRIEIRPRLTYRSQLGRLDPRVEARIQIDRRSFIDVVAGRETVTNEGWIWSDVFNSLSVIGSGLDTRNYYRADRLDVSLRRAWDTPTLRIEPFVGGRGERAWSVRPDSGATGGPWSVLGRHSEKGMLRPNPRIDAGEIASIIGGARIQWESQAIRSAIDVGNEIAVRSPGSERFAQLTVNGTISFPTFRAQHYRFDAHVVLTSGQAPPQRWAYLGGAGTIPLLHLLEQGGDELLFLDSRYEIPVDRLMLPLVGSPTFTLRHILGGAGVQHLPRLEQRVGVRIAVSALRIEVITDPVTRRAHVGFGVAFVR